MHAVTTIENSQKKTKKPEPKIQKKIESDEGKLNRRR